jgi:predicted DsbA family dithiol-disulfide isomerase
MWVSKAKFAGRRHAKKNKVGPSTILSLDTARIIQLHQVPTLCIESRTVIDGAQMISQPRVPSSVISREDVKQAHPLSLFDG